MPQGALEGVGVTESLTEGQIETLVSEDTDEDDGGDDEDDGGDDGDDEDHENHEDHEDLVMKVDL